MLAMDVWCFSKSTARIDLEKHQTRLHYWGISFCNFGESPLQFWVFLLYTKHEIFYNHNRIASHRRLYGRKGQYSTVTEHMPASHQQYLEWNGDRFRKWAVFCKHFFLKNAE